MNTIKHIEGIMPDYTGAHGKAWRCDLKAGTAEHLRLNKTQHATLESWVVYAPYAHIFWAYYWLSLIHLRPIAGLKDAVIKREGATHEIACWAMDPGQVPDLVNQFKCRLTPVNYVGQIISSDIQAVELLEKTAHEVADATLNPDTDYRATQWFPRFGNHYCAASYGVQATKRRY